VVTIAVEGWVFRVEALVGGAPDGIGFDFGGTSNTPILLGFVSMLGAGDEHRGDGPRRAG